MAVEASPLPLPSPPPDVSQGIAEREMGREAFFWGCPLWLCCRASTLFYSCWRCWCQRGWPWDPFPSPRGFRGQLRVLFSTPAPHQTPRGLLFNLALCLKDSGSCAAASGDCCASSSWCCLLSETLKTITALQSLEREGERITRQGPSQVGLLSAHFCGSWGGRSALS